MGSYYKLGQNLLQIGAGITNQGKYYNLGHNNILSYFYKLPRAINSLSPECLLNIFSNFYIPPCVGEVFIFMEFTFLENALIRDIFTHAHLHSKLVLGNYSQNEITHSPR